ncbi:hypothetical protein GCM10009706_27620 [Curtobacterium citreum]|uniref:PA14 domain-containing protein n=1 Tax=Curtobacterium citreum TaxID=2036 RepID=A0ABT2HKV1_9MICO|nr:PA14 domain-containing protein [Curtobacterium citreum]MCS6523747.1 PA14 domain-containing protein [Curtobacterium citreum]TQJ26462.1 PA14 domain-containing protein [Curtobacterium citreum]GGL87514.1 hypothetical protein GCM10009706_27620 [Curtobacterium citreum]
MTGPGPVGAVGESHEGTSRAGRSARIGDHKDRVGRGGPGRGAGASTGYDQDANGNPLRGLNATWYDNDRLAGAPKSYGLGVGGSDGSINQTWAKGSPAAAGAGFTTDNFSVRLTGLVTAPQDGTYTFLTKSDDGAQLWVDDVPLIDDWGPHSATETAANQTVTLKKGQSVKIRLQYREVTVDASLALE